MWRRIAGFALIGAAVQLAKRALLSKTVIGSAANATGVGILVEWAFMQLRNQRREPGHRERERPN
jgi:hypothetical protein